MVGLIDMNREGSASNGCWAHWETLTFSLAHNLDLGISRLNFQWKGQLTWTKGMWLDRILNPLYDLELWPHPRPWPWTFNINFWNCHFQEWKGWLMWNKRDTSWEGLLFDLEYNPDLGSFKVKFSSSCISGMGRPIVFKQKECGSIRCWTHYMTLNFDPTHDHNPGFSRSNFEIAVSQER